MPYYAYAMCYIMLIHHVLGDACCVYDFSLSCHFSLSCVSAYASYLVIGMYFVSHLSFCFFFKKKIPLRILFDKTSYFLKI
jgi:uncharacterized membrane protein (GlpM family)